MITKLASEILNGAETKAGVYNVDFLTSLTLTNALNDAYRTAYQEIAMSDSDFYIKDYRFTEDDLSELNDGWYDIPKGVYIVKSVTINDVEVPRCPPKEKIAGTYQIANGRLKFYGNERAPITIHYIPDPQTVTVPAESKELYLDPATVIEWGRMTEKGFYYKTNGGQFYYDFATNESSTVVTFQAINKKYHEGVIEYGPDYIRVVNPEDSEDVYEDLSDDYVVGDENPIVSVVVDDPYMMVSYKDGTIIVVSETFQTIWNIKARSGHKTLGTIHDLKTDDETLYGCLYEDEDGKLWLSSFVPDTMMNYPTNALFTMLEVNLACLLMSMNGIANEYISIDLKNETIAEFRKELAQNRAMPVRISNQRRSIVVRI